MIYLFASTLHSVRHTNPTKNFWEIQKLSGTSDRIMATLDKWLFITIHMFNIPCRVRIKTSNTLWMKQLISLTPDHIFFHIHICLHVHVFLHLHTCFHVHTCLLPQRNRRGRILSNQLMAASEKTDNKINNFSLSRFQIKDLSKRTCVAAVLLLIVE